MGRAPCCEKEGLKRGRWTAEEDDILAKYIAENGEGSWRSLPKNAGLLRCGKSCRLRWINYLRADVKRGNISKQEEETIIKLHATLGNRWSLIANHLPGRTDNEIKNYWNSHLSRRIDTFRQRQAVPPLVIDLSKLPGGGKRRGGRKKGYKKPQEPPKSDVPSPAPAPAPAASDSRGTPESSATASEGRAAEEQLQPLDLGEFWETDGEMEAIFGDGAVGPAQSMEMTGLGWDLLGPGSHLWEGHVSCGPGGGVEAGPLLDTSASLESIELWLLSDC